jgi:phosphatidate cytidylyltransferase
VLKTRVVTGVIAAPLFLLVVYLENPWFSVLVAAIAAMVFFEFGRMAQGRGSAWIAAAVPYAVVPGAGLVYVMTIGGRWSIFWLLAVVWATDIGAYAAGRTIGGPKLAPKISPNKTWSGAVGGLVSAIIAQAVVVWAADVAISVQFVLIAILASIVSQAGDLFESALKRRYQVKDSGGLIPGHGGVMDRFDGLWAAAPVMALFCAILGGGIEQW